MRINIRQGSFFGRLLSAFFIGGFVPFLLLAVVFISMARGILENAYSDRAKEAVEISASMMRTVISDTEAIATQMAKAPAVIQYCEGPERTATTISDVNKLIASSIGSTSLFPYIIPIDGTSPLYRGTLPDEYVLGSHGGWGILGELSRRERPTSLVCFAQPHPATGRMVPLAIGTQILGKNGIAGYLVIDIDRKLIEEKIGQTAKSGGALTELVFTDRSGCIIYDMADSRQDSFFYNPDPVLQKAFFAPDSAVAMGIEAHGLFPKKTVYDYAHKIITTALAVASISAVFFIVMAIFLAKSTSRPIHLLTLTMKNVSKGQLDVSCPEIDGASPNDEVATLIKQFNQMILRVNELVENKVEQERNLRYAELKALQAQINPHFIYNTLNSIRSVAKLKGDTETAFITTRLAKILREGSSSGSDYCTLEHSLDLARDYFAIEAWRWPGRFKLEESIDPGMLRAQVPRLIIQPLVENALSHGLENKPGEGTLSIGGVFENGDIVITISDNGVGIEEGQLATIRENLTQTERGNIDLSVKATSNEPSGLRTISGPGSGSGIGLLNTHRRLWLIYGKGYGITIASKRGEGTTITVRIPFREMEDSNCSK